MPIQNITFKELKKQGEIVSFNFKMFRNLELCWITISLIALILQLPFSESLNRIFSVESSITDPLFTLQAVMQTLASGHNLIKPGGGFNHLSFTLGVALSITVWSTIAYACDSISKVFQSFKEETSPFNKENAKHWKDCSKLCGGLAVFYLFMGGMNLLILMILLSAIFHIFYLLFVYGSELQKESDETL